MAVGADASVNLQMTGWRRNDGGTLDCLHPGCSSSLVPANRIAQRLHATELPTRPLESLMKERPILFDALHATFGHMPSSGRTAEQVHGGKVDSIRKGVCWTSQMPKVDMLQMKSMPPGLRVGKLSE
jgi:hypothetical protein